MAGISIYLVDLTKQFSVRMIFTFFHTAHVLVKTLLSRNFYGEIKECVVFTLGQLYQDTLSPIYLDAANSFFEIFLDTIGPHLQDPTHMKTP